MKKTQEQHYLDLIDENRELSYEVARLKKELEWERELRDHYEGSADFWKGSTDYWYKLYNEKHS